MQDGTGSCRAYKNREYSAEMVDMEHVEEHYIDLLYDPQTREDF